jgi:hypothetical protein
MQGARGSREPAARTLARADQRALAMLAGRRVHDAVDERREPPPHTSTARADDHNGSCHHPRLEPPHPPLSRLRPRLAFTTRFRTTAPRDVPPGVPRTYSAGSLLIPSNACRRPASDPPNITPGLACPVYLAGRGRGVQRVSGGPPFLEGPGVKRDLGPEAGRRPVGLLGPIRRHRHQETDAQKPTGMRDGGSRSKVPREFVAVSRVPLTQARSVSVDSSDTCFAWDASTRQASSGTVACRPRQ